VLARRPMLHGRLLGGSRPQAAPGLGLQHQSYHAVNADSQLPTLLRPPDQVRSRLTNPLRHQRSTPARVIVPMSVIEQPWDVLGWFGVLAQSSGGLTRPWPYHERHETSHGAAGPQAAVTAGHAGEAGVQQAAACCQLGDCCRQQLHRDSGSHAHAATSH
jgi:hypothetical protein